MNNFHYKNLFLFCLQLLIPLAQCLPEKPLNLNLVQLINNNVNGSKFQSLCSLNILPNSVIIKFNSIKFNLINSFLFRLLIPIICHFTIMILISVKMYQIFPI